MPVAGKEARRIETEEEKEEEQNLRHALCKGGVDKRRRGRELKLSFSFSTRVMSIVWMGERRDGMNKLVKIKDGG